LPESWVSLPRFHHQYLPDVIQYEAGAFDAGLIEGLSARGHQLKPLDSSYGNMQAVYWDRKNRRVHAASDPRGIGAATVEAVD
jgi:gamma-glutamyltranspeptidase/glutathione hydrolase